MTRLGLGLYLDPFLCLNLDLVGLGLGLVLDPCLDVELGLCLWRERGRHRGRQGDDGVADVDGKDDTR